MKSSALLIFVSTFVLFFQGVAADPGFISDFVGGLNSWLGGIFGKGGRTPAPSPTPNPGQTDDEFCPDEPNSPPSVSVRPPVAPTASSAPAPPPSEDEFCDDPPASAPPATGSNSGGWLSSIWNGVTSWWGGRSKREVLDELDSHYSRIYERENSANSINISLGLIGAAGLAALI